MEESDYIFIWYLYNYISLSFIIHQIILSDEISDVNMAIYGIYIYNLIFLLIYTCHWQNMALRWTSQGSHWELHEPSCGIQMSDIGEDFSASWCNSQAVLIGPFFLNTKKHDFVVGNPCKPEERLKFYENVVYHPCLIKLGMACWVSLHGFPL